MLLNCGAGEDLRVPWTARRPNQSILKEISPEQSLEGLTLKLKLQYFAHLMQSRLIRKDPDAGKDRRWEEKGTEDETVGWHHRLDGHESGQTLGDSEGQGGLALHTRTRLSDWTTTGDDRKIKHYGWMINRWQTVSGPADNGQMDGWVGTSVRRQGHRPAEVSGFDGDALPLRFVPSATAVSLSRLLAHNQLLQADVNWLLLSTVWKPSEERVPRGLEERNSDPRIKCC